MISTKYFAEQDIPVEYPALPMRYDPPFVVPPPTNTSNKLLGFVTAIASPQNFKPYLLVF